MRVCVYACPKGLLYLLCMYGLYVMCAMRVMRASNVCMCMLCVHACNIFVRMCVCSVCNVGCVCMLCIFVLYVCMYDMDARAYAMSSLFVFYLCFVCL